MSNHEEGFAPIFTLYRDYSDADGVTMCVQEDGDVDFFHTDEAVIGMSGAQFRKFVDLYRQHTVSEISRPRGKASE